MIALYFKGMADTLLDAISPEEHVSAGINDRNFAGFAVKEKPAIGEDAVRDSIPASKSPRLRIMPRQCDNRRYGHTPMSVL
jgi:hypothetical protein